MWGPMGVQAVDKHIGILRVHGENFQLQKVKLKTTRPFFIDEVILEDQEGLDANRPVTHTLT